MSAAVWVANILGWPLIHMVIGFVAIRLPQELFAHDTWITVPRRWERDGRLYRKLFAIRKWKSLLPDGAAWLGGRRKKFRGINPAGAAEFLVETRRAEIAHWCMLVCFLIFFLWNPPWARWVITAYALAANLPCILTQRYNRLAINRVARIHSRLNATDSGLQVRCCDP
jgi:glycosyl-4,4'-diaponeurosporenoate acyltransferase